MNPQMADQRGDECSLATIALLAQSTWPLILRIQTVSARRSGTTCASLTCGPTAGSAQASTDRQTVERPRNAERMGFLLPPRRPDELEYLSLPPTRNVSSPYRTNKGVCF